MNLNCQVNELSLRNDNAVATKRGTIKTGRAFAKNQQAYNYYSTIRYKIR